MKLVKLLSIALIGLTISLKAQIPNNGFENWTTVGTGENPNGWTSCNLLSGTSYPVTKSVDHYPISVGNYSARIESNLAAISMSQCGQGFLKTAKYLGDWGPVFPITGHPNNFCGYYKFLPQNNDTMMITLFLFNNGSLVATAILTGTNTTSNWTSFNIPITSYAVADSAEISFSSFYGNYGQFPYGPWGNSVMYVDNISFDNLITSVFDQTKNALSFKLYPNPGTDLISVRIDNTTETEKTVDIYNITGELICSEALQKNKHQISTERLNNGVYIVEVKSKDWSEKQKLVIQK